MTKLIVAFRKYANAPKKGRRYCVSMAAMVTRSRRHVTFYVHSLFLYSNELQNLPTRNTSVACVLNNLCSKKKANFVFVSV